MLLSQYGRFFAYMQCQIRSLMDQNVTIQCDCQLQLPQGMGDMPLSKTTFAGFEEYCLPATGWWLVSYPSDARIEHLDNYNVDVSTPPCMGIFRPPRA
jgi:hypothetical protein